MTAAVGPQAPADAEVCRGCSHGRGAHKRGKGGCREVDCACGRYEVDQRAQRTELNAALATQIEETQEVAAELAEERREHQATALRLGQVRGELANLRRQVVEREEQIARERGARMAEIVQLRAEVELDRATAGRRVQVPAADGEVVSRYAAYLCLACSARYGKPYTDHGCGPLVPVVVTIARADRPGPDTSKETAR